MRYTDLELTQLLDFQPTGGVIRFAGQRALITDAVALGLLRKELIETVGLTVARGVLTRFGYAHGWRVAATLQKSLPWDSERDWRIAGGRLHMLQGAVVMEPVSRDPSETDVPFAEAIWHESYEAEQHLLNLERSSEPVCWTLCGYASGYLSYATGKEIYCIEEKCLGCGDSKCKMVGRALADWGDTITPYLPYYRKECLDESLERVRTSLKKAESELNKRRREIAETSGDDDVAGRVVKSEAMKRVVDLARRVAKADATVLVTGESGVGKERIARLVHDESTRARGPFVAVNCGAVTETLLESELFGHARGSFTGATHDRVGFFEAANGGTLFLDEIGEISPGLHVKLLRVLQEREDRRDGESRNRAVDVRVLAATHRNLTEEVGAGRFRQDLYYRLRVIELHIPPLRERRDDVLALASAMMGRASRRMSKKILGFTPAAADQLVRYAWPGNVRELENAIERATVLCETTHIDLIDLPEEVRFATPAPAIRAGIRPLEDVEREYILAALEANGGNQARTAAQLGIGTATLYRRLKQYEREAGV